jgi:hypothetical protein
VLMGNNIKIHLKCADVDTIQTPQDTDKWLAVVNTVMKLWVP